jgi:hypothetical protein
VRKFDLNKYNLGANDRIAQEDFKCDFCNEIIPKGSVYKKIHPFYNRHLEVDPTHTFGCGIVRLNGKHLLGQRRWYSWRRPFSLGNHKGVRSKSKSNRKI